MPRTLTPYEIAETIRIRNSCNSSGEAAQILGLSESAFNTRWRRIRGQSLVDDQAPIPPTKPRISVRAATQFDDEEREITTILAIGDHHDKPGRDKKRATWIGRLAAEIRPDAIIQIGDWASLDSLSQHEAAGSQPDIERPSYVDELDSLAESLAAFHRDFPIGTCPTFITLGNHEYRAHRLAINSPKASADTGLRLEQVFAQFRWVTHPYGEFLTIAGVDWVHIPKTVMGKDFGGVQVERTLANKAIRSLVVGHTHRASVFTDPKVGQLRSIKVVNLGTSMPHGMIERYTGLSMSGWDYGVCVLRIQNGQILSVKHIDMLELFERFGD